MNTIEGHYTLYSTEDSLLLLRDDNKPIDREERDSITLGARNACKIQRENAAVSKALNLAQTASWYFPQERRDLWGITSGVYFVIDFETRPSQVKIGYTTGSILSRIRQLKSSENCKKPRAIAFMHTKYPKEVEDGFHVFLSDFRIEREWFDMLPVLDFLKPYVSGRMQ